MPNIEEYLDEILLFYQEIDRDPTLRTLRIAGCIASLTIATLLTVVEPEKGILLLKILTTIIPIHIKSKFPMKNVEKQKPRASCRERSRNLASSLRR